MYDIFASLRLCNRLPRTHPTGSSVTPPPQSTMLTPHISFDTTANTKVCMNLGICFGCLSREKSQTRVFRPTGLGRQLTPLPSPPPIATTTLPNGRGHPPSKHPTAQLLIINIITAAINPAGPNYNTPLLHHHHFQTPCTFTPPNEPPRRDLTTAQPPTPAPAGGSARSGPACPRRSAS